MIKLAFRRTLLTLAALLLVLTSVSGLAQQSKDAGKKHFLWKVTSPTKTLYLLGSMHFLKPTDYPLDSAYEQAYAVSRQLFLEVNLNTVDEQKLRQLTFEKASYSSGQSLSTSLSKKAYDQVKPKLTELGIDSQQAEGLRPWVLAMTIAVGELQKLGYDPNQGVDRYFNGKAIKEGKTIDGFETAEYQLNLLADMPDNVQEQMLLQTLRDLQETESHFSEICTAWKKGDADALEAYLLKSFKEYPTVYQSLLVKRNKNWIPKIERLLDQKESALVVVGAAHLVGKEGIISLLKEKGYQVEQQ